LSYKGDCQEKFFPIDWSREKFSRHPAPLRVGIGLCAVIAAERRSSCPPCAIFCHDLL